MIQLPDPHLRNKIYFLLFCIEVLPLITALLIFKPSCQILVMQKSKQKILLQYFFTGDFNAHSKYWWSDSDTTPEGSEIELLLSSLGLSQVISEPTNFEPNKNPSCIDLVITDQPNLFLDSGTRTSLDLYCHHQIICCKVNIRIPPPPPLDRKIWHFNRANLAAIKRSMINFPWLERLNLNTDTSWQVKTFTEIF